MKFQKRLFWFATSMLLVGILGLCLMAGGWLLGNARILQQAANAPVGAYLMLGGSIRREIHTAQLANQDPDLPILISQGSPDPCILLIFQRANAPLQQVFLEKCAQSTFGNFYYSLPLLQQWGVQKIKLITSETHLPRAMWLAQIILGSHGIWVEVDPVKEQGTPGNRESWIKTSIDVSRSLVWAALSHFYQPICSDVIPLTAVNLDQWQEREFHCEHQGNLN